MLGVAKVDQRIEARHRLENDVAALTAVTAVWSAIFDKLLAPEADRAGAARAGANEDLCLVEKMHGRRFNDKCGEKAAPDSSAAYRDLRAVGVEEAGDARAMHFARRTCEADTVVQRIRV